MNCSSYYRGIGTIMAKGSKPEAEREEINKKLRTKIKTEHQNKDLQDTQFYHFL
jgi:hypothetical protein